MKWRGSGKSVRESHVGLVKQCVIGCGKGHFVAIRLYMVAAQYFLQI